MNALVRVSAVLTNAPYILNLDCDHYVNNSKVIHEAMCFMMDPLVGRNVCDVQFPQRFDGIDKNDRYANRNTVFFDIKMKGLDGIQGPVYVGIGCVFNRQAPYGYGPLSLAKLAIANPSRSCFPSLCCCCLCCRRKMVGVDDHKKTKYDNLNVVVFNLHEIEGYDEYEKQLLIPQRSFKKSFGQFAVFIASTLMENGSVPESNNPASLIKEAIHVISCGYEEKIEWGKEVG